MKITKTLIYFLVLAPLSLQASYFSFFSAKSQCFFKWMFSCKQNPSLDELANKNINTFLHEQKELKKQLSPHISAANKAHFLREKKQKQKAYINEFCNAIITLQQNGQFANNNELLIKQASKQADKKYAETKYKNTNNIKRSRQVVFTNQAHYENTTSEQFDQVVFAGQARPVGKINSNIDMYEYIPLPQKHRHDEFGRYCENGYRDRNGNIPEVD